MKKLGDLACSFFYTGHSPIISGTTGTLGAMVLVVLIPLVPGLHFGWTCLGLAAFFMIIGVPLGHWGEQYYGSKDPKPFVLDEVMGMFVVLVRADPEMPGWKELVTAFVLFRVFDILKLFPARQLEHLKGGWGIMLDDLAAAIYGWGMLWVLREWLGW